MAVTSTTDKLGAFGIKEVADVRFYRTTDVTYTKADGTTPAKIEATGEPVLEFDTLKVSNVEFTAEQTDAKGGKGNLPLLTWDYNREVNITLEDALLSMKTLKAMFGEKGTGNSITIGGSTFPGNYAIVGVTYARDQKTGDDHLFTFFVPNAKMGSEITLTMEAEGDPTVFTMNMKALRASKDDDTIIALIADEDNVYTPGTDIFSSVIE